MQIAAGYEDANDSNDMRLDDVMKLCSGSDKLLASQPTMSRFENQPGPELSSSGSFFYEV